MTEALDVTLAPAETITVELAQPEAIVVSVVEPEAFAVDLAEPELLTVTIAEPEVIEVSLGGEIGPRGPAGPAGTGEGGGSAVYRHHQAVPTSSWFVQHDLGYYPAVTTQDSAGTVVAGDVFYVDETALIITFAVPFGGYANLS